jgi:acetoin:2,6-dichlorophenolindophenol oxidoreductase subunit beta
VVDEDYREYGLSGELAALVLKAGLCPRTTGVCIEGTLPYTRELEEAALSNVGRIREAVHRVIGGGA